jgi:hypothetical protein
MTTSYYRVQSPDRNAADLLDATFQTSDAWHRDDLTRNGVSVCDSRETLAAYLAFAGSGIPYGSPGWVLVELDGTPSADQPLDAEYGELLVHPTRIISVAPIDDEFFDLIGAAYDALED